MLLEILELGMEYMFKINANKQGCQRYGSTSFHPSPLAHSSNSQEEGQSWRRTDGRPPSPTPSLPVVRAEAAHGRQLRADGQHSLLRADADLRGRGGGGGRRRGTANPHGSSTA